MSMSRAEMAVLLAASERLAAAAPALDLPRLLQRARHCLEAEGVDVDALIREARRHGGPIINGMELIRRHTQGGLNGRAPKEGAAA